MTITLWGFDGGLYFGLPQRVIGYALLIFYLFGLSLLITRRSQSAPTDSRSETWRVSLLAALVAVAPILAETFLFRLETPTGLVAPGEPLEPPGPSFSFFGALPWVVAGGMLGQGQAVLVGLAAGFVRGGFGTLRILTPFRIALQAGFVAWLLRRDYLGWMGGLLRHPFVSATLSGFLFAAFDGLELFAYSGGGFYDGFDFAFTRLGPTLLVTVLEAATAGAICEGLRLAFPNAWYVPDRLSPAPFSRSLAARLVSTLLIIGVFAGSALLYGDWLLARRAARELIQDQMALMARQAGEGIPFFVQTGRTTIRQLADDMLSLSEGSGGIGARLEDSLRSFPYFTRLAVFNPMGDLLGVAPRGGLHSADLSLEFQAGLRIALDGVPMEFVLQQPGGENVQMAFFAPLVAPSGEPVLGALVGWTGLATNPLLQPTIALLEEQDLGEAYLMDDQGGVILKAGQDRSADPIELSGVPLGETFVESAPDGTRRLVYINAIQGFPWYVVVSAPQREVDQLALRLSTRLFAAIVAVGVAILVVAYVSSRRITQPLRQMASAAESMARGNLEEVIEGGGEDEIGRLAFSFERMRRWLKSRWEEMNLLLMVSQRMASSFNLRESLPPILKGVQRITSTDCVRLVLAPTDEMSPTRWEVYAAGEDTGNWSALDPQLLELARVRGQFVLENPGRAKAVLDLKGLTQPLEALMVLPMRNEESFVGALWLGYRRPHASSTSEVHLLSILAGQLGISVANARLFHQAEHERQQLLAVLEATPDVVIVTDPFGRISLANPAAEVVLRGPPVEAFGKPAEEWITAPSLVELLASPLPETATTEIEVKGSRTFYASVSGVQAIGNDRSGRVCVLWDITHYKRLDALKSEFVSTVSHDLRAPLTLMRGYGTMISMVGSLNDQQKTFVRKIMDSVDQMSKLVDNLLDLGRIEAGIGLNLEAVLVEDVIREVINNYRPRAINKQIGLEVQLAEGMQTITVDPTLLRQAISNLVENAVKYTQAGGRVLIQAEQVLGKQVIRVIDTGLGIAPTDKARLFEKFFRARRRETVHEKGTGLGLAIVKSIVEQHAGRITVESRLGSGSTFTIEIPTKPEADGTSAMG